MGSEYTQLQDSFIDQPTSDGGPKPKKAKKLKEKIVGWPRIHQLNYEAAGMSWPLKRMICGLGERESEIVHFYMHSMPMSSELVCDVSQNWTRLPMGHAGEVPTLTGNNGNCCVCVVVSDMLQCADACSCL